MVCSQDGVSDKPRDLISITESGKMIESSLALGSDGSKHHLEESARKEMSHFQSRTTAVTNGELQLILISLVSSMVVSRYIFKPEKSAN